MKNIKNQFPWIAKHPDWVYADSGATSLKPQCVLDAINNFYIDYGTNTHSTDSAISYSTSEYVAASRQEIAAFIGCHADELIFTSGATESLNMIAFGLIPFLQPGDEIVTTYGEHGSNLMPWQVLEERCGVVLKYAGQQNALPTVQDIVSLVNEKTKVVTFASGYNLTGHQFDEKTITQAVKAKNPHTMVCVDMTQSIQHRPFNAHECGCDFAACSGHKIFAPTGIGLAFLKKEHQAKMLPYKYGGGMNFRLDKHSYELMENTDKFEGGTPNIEGIFGFRAAVQFVKELGYDYIQQQEAELVAYAKQELSKIDNVILVNEDMHAPILAFGLQGVFAQDLATYLGSKKIIVRGGLSCAKLIPNIIGCFTPVRASLFVYNDKQDIDRICQALREYKKGDELDGIL